MAVTVEDDTGSENEENYDDLHLSQNRRGKKAGGWQVLGKYFDSVVVHIYISSL